MKMTETKKEGTGMYLMEMKAMETQEQEDKEDNVETGGQNL